MAGCCSPTGCGNVGLGSLAVVDRLLGEGKHLEGAGRLPRAAGKIPVASHRLRAAVGGHLAAWRTGLDRGLGKLSFAVRGKHSWGAS